MKRLFTIILLVIFAVTGCGKTKPQNESSLTNSPAVSVSNEKMPMTSPSASSTPSPSPSIAGNKGLQPVDDIRAAAANIQSGMSCQEALKKMPEPQVNSNGMYVWTAKDGGGFVLMCSSDKITQMLSKITENQFSQIQTGMDCTEVKKALGEPSSTVKYETAEAMVWDIVNSNVKGIAYCTNGKISKTEKSNEVHDPTKS